MAKIDGWLMNLDIERISDIHIASGLRPMMRIDGKRVNCHDDIVAHEVVEEYIREWVPDKFEELLKNGEIDFKYIKPGLCNFRVNAFKCKGSYCICMRVINKKIPQRKDLSNIEILSKFTEFNDGLVIVTGPTGSGKSTTLAAMINEINMNKQKHIITLEDPIEYVYENKKSMINQREVGLDTKSYSMGLRAALRQDPDVILVGEMRDSETIEVALRAAQTGHLVFSTLHNMGAADSIYRIVNSFRVEHQNEIKIQLASLLRGVISQILIPKESGEGRIVAMEVMVCTPGIRNLIREGNYEQIKSFIQMGSKYGMQTMEMDLRRLLDEESISRDEYDKWISCL